MAFSLRTAKKTPEAREVDEGGTLGVSTLLSLAILSDELIRTPWHVCRGGGKRRYWGLLIEIQRLRAVEERRRLAWEERIRATRQKMVAVR